MPASGTPSRPRWRARASILGVVAVAALLAGCGGSGSSDASTSAGGANGVFGDAPASASGAASGAPTPSSAPPSAALPSAASVSTPLNCSQLAEAPVTTATVKLPDYPFDSINLTGGRWAAEDGTEILLQTQCGIGDFVGDASLDAVGVVTLSTGGTGKFYQLVAWRNTAGSPTLAATAALGDRTPVLSISIAGTQIKVVYLTRADGASMAELNIKRTALYKVSGAALVEVSHTDAAYTP